MYSALLKSLNIEKREANMVWLLVFQSFFIGVFFATLENSATTLFMMKYGKDMLGNAYLISGLLGMVLTGAFSFFQSKIKYSVLITINLLFISLLTLAMWMSFDYSDSEYLVFVIFSLMGALYILSIVGFSGLAGRLFTLRQGKRLFSIIDSGLVFGMIVISLAIPYILNLIPELKDLIMISAVSIFFALIIQSIITFKYRLNDSGDTDQRSQPESEKQRTGLGLFIGNRYVRLLSLFVILSMVALFFTSYNFLTVGQINYPDQKDFSIFFAQFTIAVMAFSFIIKTFIYSKLLKTYGLQVSLIVTPILIGFFVLVSAVVGTIFGYETDTASFVIFFLLISLVRFFAINLKDSITTPSLRLLFQPIDSRIRYNVQAKVEGLVNEISAVFSGLVLALLGTLVFLELINYSHILILIVGLWIYITVQLYREYQNMLRKSLVDYKKKHTSDSPEVQSEATINSNNALAFEKIERTLDMMREYEPTLFDIKLNQLLKENSIQAREIAIRSIDESEIYSSVNELKKIAIEDADPSIRKLADEVRMKLEKSYKELLDEEKILYLARSKNEEDRIKAVKIIGDSGNHGFTTILKNLLKDLSPQVKLQAIHAVSKFNNPDLWPLLIEQLADSRYRAAAKASIIQIGEPAMESLERAFYKSGAQADLLLSVVELYGKISGEKSVKYLLKKLNDPNRQVVLEALYALKALNYAPEDENIRSQIYQTIEQNVGLAAWNLAAQYDIQEQGLSPYLVKAFDRELKDNFEVIFLLLSLVYDPQSIQHIRENIESGTTEGVSFAIEMLDLFIADQLKSFLFPLLEDNRIDEKIKELELHFPINVYGNTEILKQIMNRSANFLNNFTRACAIYTYLTIEEEQKVIGNDIIANLFNQDPLLSETAAIVMSEINPSIYETSKARLKDSMREALDQSLVSFKQDKFSSLIEKVIFLNQSELKDLDEKLLENLALNMKHGSAKAGTKLVAKGIENSYFVLISGIAESNVPGTPFTFEPGMLINELFFLDSDENGSSIAVTEDVEFLAIGSGEFKRLLFRYPELSNIMLKVFDTRINQTMSLAS